MGSRIELSVILHEILSPNNPDSANVYFQPPDNYTLDFPCIVYRKTEIDQKYGNDKTYIHTAGYTVTIMDKNPDSLLGRALIDALPMASFKGSYRKNNVFQEVYKVYF